MQIAGITPISITQPNNSAVRTAPKMSDSSSEGSAPESAAEAIALSERIAEIFAGNPAFKITAGSIAAERYYSYKFF